MIAYLGGACALAVALAGLGDSAHLAAAVPQPSAAHDTRCQAPAWERSSAKLCLARDAIEAELRGGAFPSRSLAARKTVVGQPPADSAGQSYQRRTRAAIEEVLAEREFADLHTDPYAFWRRLRDWILSLLGHFFSALGHLPGWVLWIIVAWMMLTLLAILGHLVYTLSTVLGGASRASGAGPSARGHPGELLGIRQLDFDSVHAEARRRLDAGDWSAATRYLYVAAILWLDRQGSVAFRLAKTNRDYIDELRAQDRLRGPFSRLTACFESVVYGGRPATVTTGHEMADTLEGLFHEFAGAGTN
jgi:hypothetical protein